MLVIWELCFRSEHCLDYVEKTEDRSVNFSVHTLRLNLQHKNTNVQKNGSEIIKQFLIESDCNLERFKKPNTVLSLTNLVI